MDNIRPIDANALKELEPHYSEDGYRVFYEFEIDKAPTITPEISNGDLISRKALKMEIERTFDMQDLYLPVHFLDLIDKAPTI